MLPHAPGARVGFEVGTPNGRLGHGDRGRVQWHLTSDGRIHHDLVRHPNHRTVGRPRRGTLWKLPCSITARFQESNVFRERNMMALKQILIGGLAVVGLTTAAFAQSHSTDEETACRRDAAHFCRGLSQDYQVRDCLVGQKQRISLRCRQVLESHGF